MFGLALKTQEKDGTSSTSKHPMAKHQRGKCNWVQLSSVKVFST